MENLSFIDRLKAKKKPRIYLSNGKPVPRTERNQRGIAISAIRSAKTCKDLAFKATSLTAFINWYEQMLIHYEDATKLNKVAFSGSPHQEYYIMKDEFQLHCCDTIVRLRDVAMQDIRVKFKNSTEYQQRAIAQFEKDIDKVREKLSLATEEKADEAIRMLKMGGNIRMVNNPASQIIYDDEMFPDAVEVILETGQASVPALQRGLKLGYARAAHIVDEMEEKGIVGPYQGSKPREILFTKEQWQMLKCHAKHVSCADELENEQSSKAETKTENAMLKAQLAAALAEKEKLERTVNREIEDKMTVAKAELLTIDLMEGHDFENWCAEALRNSGFTNVSVTPGSCDQGVDVVAEKDGLKYAVQCKRYNSDLGNTPVQEVFTGARLYNCHVGVVITNRNFTSGAKDAATATGVLLWGRPWILKYLYQKHGVMPEIDLI